jgi:hypothetical protein
MTHRYLIAAIVVVTVSLFFAFRAAPAQQAQQQQTSDRGWKYDPIWHDGQVEKAVYSASRVVYGKPRAYEMIVFTNKEQHDAKTLTKAEKSDDTVEVWKHNQIENIPTPNYTYHYESTSHYTVDTMELTRLDVSSQEFCGTSFKQYQRQWPDLVWDYWAFSYFPEAGRKTATIRGGMRKIVAADALPLVLRDYDFQRQGSQLIALLPDQTNNRHTPHEPVEGEVRYAGEEGDNYKLEVHADGKLLGTYWMAKDRLHVMTKYRSADGQQTYELKGLSRTNYWTLPKE